MARYVCPICGYVHDDSNENMDFLQLPDDWVCPVCGAVKNQFQADVAEGTTEVPAVAVTPGRKNRALLVHRVFGYVFLGVYLFLMIQMVPRLWNYQIEFPARTVVHISLGMAVGVMLFLKVSVVRFFRRLDPSLVPLLGTALLVSSVVLIGISVPAAFREAFTTATLFAEENRERVQILLTQTGLDPAESAKLSTTKSLRAGQRVLRQECIDCHDLRTVLAKPRTPSSWRQTVSRMADRSTLMNPLEDDEQWQVTAYLTALSPRLHKSARQLSDEADRRDRNRKAAEAITTGSGASAAFDAAKAKTLFEAKCSQCHETSLVTENPPREEGAARQLVAAMVDEGLEASEGELAMIVEYLTRTYTK